MQCIDVPPPSYEECSLYYNNFPSHSTLPTYDDATQSQAGVNSRNREENNENHSQSKHVNIFKNIGAKVTRSFVCCVNQVKIPSVPHMFTSKLRRYMNHIQTNTTLETKKYMTMETEINGPVIFLGAHPHMMYGLPIFTYFSMCYYVQGDMTFITCNYKFHAYLRRDGVWVLCPNCNGTLRSFKRNTGIKYSHIRKLPEIAMFRIKGNVATIQVDMAKVFLGSDNTRVTHSTLRTVFQCDSQYAHTHIANDFKRLFIENYKSKVNWYETEEEIMTKYSDVQHGNIQFLSNLPALYKYV